MLQLVVSFLILSYPTQDLESYGMQFLVRTRKRGVWWISKSIWNILSVALFYLIGIFVAFIFSILLGDGSFAFHQEITLFVSEFSSSAGYAQTLAVVLILPFLTSAAMAAFQMMLNFVLRPVYGYMIVTAIFWLRHTIIRRSCREIILCCCAAKSRLPAGSILFTRFLPTLRFCALHSLSA